MGTPPFRSVATAMSSLALAACAAGPDYRPPSSTALGVPAQWSVAAPAGAADLAAWWNGFDDPLLGRLVEQAVSANLDIAQAEARLRQARAALVTARAQGLPQASLGADGGRSERLRGGPPAISATSLSLALDASWQADLFGGVRRGVEAARADWQASGYDRAAVLLAVQSETARNYVLARAAQAQLATARQSLAIQDDNLAIAGFRVQAGLVSSLDLEQARSARAQAAAAIPAIEQSYNAAVSRLGVLTGQAPGALKPVLAAPAPIPPGPDTIGTGLPADLLRRRPDVLAAERALAAATARIGVAQAQLYPALTITGSVQTGSVAALPQLFDTITGNLFGRLAQSVFAGGALRAQTRAARAQADGAFAAYKAAVLTALEDTENAVVAMDSARRRTSEFARAADAAEAAALLARSQYRSGLTDFTTLNTAEAALVSARTSLLQAQSDQAQAAIALFTALGGGWTGAAPSAPAVTLPSTPTG